MDVLEKKDEILSPHAISLYHTILKTIFQVGTLESDLIWRTNVHHLQDQFKREVKLLQQETLFLQEDFPNIYLLYSITDTHKETGQNRNVWYEVVLAPNEGYLLVTIPVKNKTNFKREIRPYYKLFSHTMDRIDEASYSNPFPLCKEKSILKTVEGCTKWLQEKSPYRLCYLLGNATN